MNYEEFFPIENYYINYIQPINPSKYFIGSGGKLVCPCHPDVNPSMGIIHRKDATLVHCFGCGFWGDIVKLHQKVKKRLFNQYLSEKDCKRDLCRIFNIDYSSLPKEEEEPLKDKSIREEIAVIRAEGKFSIQDYRNLILQGKKDKKPVAYFNNLMVTMIENNKEE